MLDKNIDINIIAFSCGVTEQYVNWFMSSKYFTTAQNSREVIQAINNHLSV